MIGCRRWFVGGTKDEPLPHDDATGERGLRGAVLVVRDQKGDTHSTLHSLSSTFRNYTHSEPRFRALLTEGDTKHLALEWT
jgi:hypothetical protein